MRIFVLLFNVGTDNEGLHSRREGDRDIVLMFEDEDDATRYALMLEAQDFMSATVEAMDKEEIQEFCDSAGYEARFLPKGKLDIPPENNVETMSWREDGQYEEDPHGKRGDRTSDDKPSVDASIEDESGSLSDDELNRLRRQLEKLL